VDIGVYFLGCGNFMSSSLEERVAKIEGVLEQMDKRLNHIESEVRDLKNLMEAWRADFDRKLGDMKASFEKRIENLRMELYGEIGGLKSEIGYLKSDLNNRFYWLLGIQITMWVTIILTIIFK
jgi:predicted  nucleic acid-binding Zn-ribbon protein